MKKKKMRTSEEVMGTGEYNAVADVNNDGIVNFTDYMSILTIMGNQ